MKRIVLMCCVLVVGCAEDQDNTSLDSRWNVSWEMNNEHVDGELILFKDNHARLSVFGNPGSLFVRDTSSVDYRWQLKNHKLILQRLDNNVKLQYKVLNQSSDYLELSFAEDIIVKLHRKEVLANI